MYKKMIALLTALLILISGCESIKQTNWEIFSPDKRIKISVYQVPPINQLYYDVQFKSNDEFVTVIDTSPLGIIRKDENFISNLSFNGKSSNVIDEEYKMITGKQSKIHNFANEYTLSFSNENNAKIDLILRAYNDGIAFRYYFPEKSDKKTVINEASGFKIPLSGKTWIAPYDTVAWWAPAYETYYENEIPVGTTSPNPNGWSFPALFEVNKCWVLLSEADLNETYCGMHFQAEAKDGLYTMRFPETAEAEGLGESFPSSPLPWETPWRTVIIGDNLGDIVESNMINNLSDASIIDDADWIIPGRASWSWWSDNTSARNYNKLVPFVDLAAEFNWEYTLVDAGWDSMKNGNIKKLVEYAQSKNIGVLLWFNSSGPHTIYPAFPRDLMYDEKIRQHEMEKISSWGVKGVKVDFFQSDKQNIIKLYHDIMKDAVKYKLMVNFHGCTLPRGWSRTYPNLVAMEAVKGEEVYRFGKFFPEKAPIHNTTLPFTRNVVGHMDYTPVGFSDRKYPHLTSWSHELALSIVFESGIIHFADGVNIYKSLPDYIKKFLTKVPTSWDETKYIAGYPGKYIVLARRKGDVWYIAGINGESTPKTIEFSLPFLQEGNMNMNLILDGVDMKNFSHQTEICDNKSKISVNLLARGGFSGIISK